MYKLHCLNYARACSVTVFILKKPFFGKDMRWVILGLKTLDVCILLNVGF